MNSLFKSDDFVPVHETGAKIKAVGYAAKHSFSNLKPFEFERSVAQGTEVQIDVLFCGVCHSDIHQVKNEWKNTVYPCMPGHEVVGARGQTRPQRVEVQGGRRGWYRLHDRQLR